MTQLDRLEKARAGLGGVLVVFAGALLIIMTILVLYQVFTRYVLGDPAAFTEELVRYALIWTSFIGAAYAFLHRRHMALVIVRDRWGPTVRRRLTLGSDLLVLAFAVLVLIVGGTMLAVSARNDFSALLGISRGLVYAIAPISGLAIGIAQVINIWEDLAGDPTTESEGVD
jgi:TRAP-type C4-dicarboxylate transport system permease small subunit